MQEFIKQIIKNLESNGFPVKKVSLPTLKMYEIADTKGLSLNKVLDQLRDEYKIDVEIGDEKIVFTKLLDTTTAHDFPNINPDMMSQVQEMLSKMDPAELQRIQEQVANMSEEERQQLMSQAKGMGLF